MNDLIGIDWADANTPELIAPLTACRWLVNNNKNFFPLIVHPLNPFSPPHPFRSIATFFLLDFPFWRSTISTHRCCCWTVHFRWFAFVWCFSFSSHHFQQRFPDRVRQPGEFKSTETVTAAAAHGTMRRPDWCDDEFSATGFDGVWANQSKKQKFRARRWSRWLPNTLRANCRNWTRTWWCRRWRAICSDCHHRTMEEDDVVDDDDDDEREWRRKWVKFSTKHNGADVAWLMNGWLWWMITDVGWPNF